MKGIITMIALLLMGPAGLSAQEADHQPHGQGYIFVGEGTHQMGLTAGFGGEGYFYKGLGLGAEMETTGFRTSANGNPNWIAVASADLSYHFFPKKIVNNVAPFVAGGYSNFFGQDTDVSGNYVHGFNIGGGVDAFATKHVGVRIDVRYNGHGGRILWASFPSQPQFSFTVFRIAFTFR